MKQFFKLPLLIGMTIAIQLACSSSSYAGETKPSSIENTTQNTQTKEFTFDFKNTYDYAACLDVILLAYEKRNAELENAFKNDCATDVLSTYGNNLSKDEALQLVESADIYATEALVTPLYPTLGLRRRIAINLGYVYDTDKNNPDILKYTNAEAE